MEKDFFERIKKIGKKIEDDAKGKLSSAKNMYDVYNELDSEEKEQFKEELINSGKSYVREKLDLFKTEEIDKEDKENNSTYEDLDEDSQINSDIDSFNEAFSSFFKDKSEKMDNYVKSRFREELFNSGKKIAKAKIYKLKKTGANYSKRIKKNIEKKISEFDDKTVHINNMKSYDCKLTNMIDEYSNTICEQQILVMAYECLYEDEKQKLYYSLSKLFLESKKLVLIYNELPNEDKEKYYDQLKFSTLNLYNIISIYNNSYNHDKYGDYVKTFDLYDNIVDVEKKVIGITQEGAHIFDTHLYNADGYKRRYDGIKDKANRVCIYDSSDNLTAIYIDNCDNRYNPMDVGYAYKVNKKTGNKVYIANCKLDYIIDFKRARFDMYNEDLVIPNYYENDKSTESEINEILNYIECKYQLHSDNKAKIR